MYYRALLLLITALWVTMWAMLIRSEVQPGGAGVRSLPVEHVLNEIFRNERSSNLRLSDGTEQIGRVRLVPKMREDGGARSLDVTGNVSLTVPGANRQRISWEGTLLLGPTWEVQSLRLMTVTREISPPPTTPQERLARPQIAEPTRLDLLLQPPAKLASYTVKLGDEILDQQEITLNEAGMAGLLTHLGVDASWQKQLHPGKAAHPEFTARMASLVVRGVKLETYLLTIAFNRQTLLHVQVSQIGEILQAETLLGWKLEQD